MWCEPANVCSTTALALRAGRSPERSPFPSATRRGGDDRVRPTKPIFISDSKGDSVLSVERVRGQRKVGKPFLPERIQSKKKEREYEEEEERQAKEWTAYPECDSK